MKTCVVTTSRADFGIYLPLLKELQDDSFFNLKILVLGTHLEPQNEEFLVEIKKTQFNIQVLKRSLFETDTSFDMAQAIGRTTMVVSEYLKNSSIADVYIVLGDRFEMFAATSTIATMGLRLAHFHGGETTFGAIDDKYRHAITHLSDYHFASCNEYRQKIINMKGSSENVFNVGSLSLDSLENLNFHDLEETSKLTGIDFSRPVCLLTFHPVTKELSSNADQIKNLLAALGTSNFSILITGVNEDPSHKEIKDAVVNFQNKNSNRVKYIQTLGKRLYFSCMKYAKFMLGNSSSGILEAASFNLPVVNVGNRQLGRVQSGNVIDTDYQQKSIEEAIKKVLSISAPIYKNIYENPSAVADTIEILKKLDI